MEVCPQGHWSLGKRRGGVLARLSPRQRAGFFSDLSTDFHFFTVQWTTRTFLQKSRTRSTRWAWSCALFLVTFLHVAESRAQTPDYTQQLRDIDNSLTLLNTTLGNIWNPGGPYLSDANFDFQQDILLDYLVGPQDATSGQRVSPSSTRNFLALLQQLNANMKRAGDLSGNAWWATNSGFVLTRSLYDYAYPDDGQSYLAVFSFPQFLSRWSGMMTYAPSTASSLRSGAWYNFFGYSRLGNDGSIQSSPYTWFDWVSDAMRSNLVASATSRSLVETSPSDIEEIVTTDWDTYSEPLETDVTTNSVPEFEIEIPDAPNIDPFTSAAVDLHGALPSSGNGSPVITVIPAFSFGSVHTPVGTAPLAASIGTDATTPFYNAVHLVSSWAWKLLGFLCVFFIVKHEYNFWTTLGGSASE